MLPTDMDVSLKIAATLALCTGMVVPAESPSLLEFKRGCDDRLVSRCWPAALSLQVPPRIALPFPPSDPRNRRS